MSSKYDVVIIGAGILGCFAARALSRYALNIAVLEKREDVSTGITRANTGIIYQGYDQHPGSLKAELTRKASLRFPDMCHELDVPFRKTGLLMVSFGPNADRVLKKKISQGAENGITDIRLLNSDEVYEIEPHLRGGISHALYSEQTYTVNPWDLGIAAFENARANGINFFFNEEVGSIARSVDGFTIETASCTYQAERVLCTAGFSGDRLWEMVSPPQIRIVPMAADYLVFDKYAGGMINHVISVEPEEKGEGLTLVPTADGNILAGPTRRDLPGWLDKSDVYEASNISHSMHGHYAPGPDGATASSGIKELLDKCSWLVPDLPQDMVIRNFGAARPNPYQLDAEGNLTGKSLSDFVILEDDGFFDLIGVKTPGITCADELGKYMAERIVSSFEKRPAYNAAFNPNRKGIIKVSHLAEQEFAALPSEYHEIICRCEKISLGEILEAIRRGATTIDGIKRRTGAGMGRCQGGYCMEKILKILSEQTGTDINKVTKDGAGSEILT